MRKKLILVTSPPACGKTFISKKLAEHLQHVVYLDKDTLIVLSKQIFKVAGEEYNRSSDFFEEHIRDYEYDAIIDLGLEALLYEDMLLINAPFTREIRDKKFMDSMKAKLAEINVKTIKSHAVETVEAAKEAAKELGYPVIVRAAYALGGLGSGFCNNEEELVTLCESSFSFSPQVLVEKALKGWLKECRSLLCH